MISPSSSSAPPSPASARLRRICGGVVLVLAVLSTLVLDGPVLASKMPYEIDVGGISFQSPLTPLEEPRGSQSVSSMDVGTIIHEREFVSPQARVQIDCQRDKTIIKVNFTKPFNGIIGAGKLDVTSCKVLGDGRKYYELQVAHNASAGEGFGSNCDTHWDSTRSSISNTLFIRFHSSLETGSDIAKNIMCRLTVGDLVVGRRPSSMVGKLKRKNQGANSWPEVRALPTVNNNEEVDIMMA